MNKLRCFLTGGHKLVMTKFFSTYDWFTKEFIVYQRCAKCGKRFDARIPESVVVDMMGVKEVRDAFRH